jgi:hypothetical protein
MIADKRIFSKSIRGLNSMAAILVAKARPPMPRYLLRIKFRTMFTAMVALIIGVLVPCKA